jgi:hypothetical protein
MTDISPEYWAAEYIDDLVARKIVNGYPQADGTFIYDPEKNISRAEIVKLLVVSLDLDWVEGYDGSRFADWEETDVWAKPYIAAAVDAGIVMGSNENGGIYLNGSQNVTREELIAMAVRALEIDIPVGAVAEAPDFGKTQDWAKDSVAFALNNKIINTERDGSVRPSDATVRSEAAMVLFMLIKYLKL